MKYLECSAKEMEVKVSKRKCFKFWEYYTFQGLRDVFDEAIMAALNHGSTGKKKTICCLL